MKQPNVVSPNPEFTQLVRDALAHLYDPAYLQNHPLASMLDVNMKLDRATRAHKLRRVLIECIEALVPELGQPDQSRAKRACTVLTGRYVDELSVEEIGRELGISERQFYREHKKGLEAVVSLLWERVQEKAGESGPTSSLAAHAVNDRVRVTRAELDRLQPSAHVKSLAVEPILRNVLDLLDPLIQQAGIQVRTRAMCPSASISTVADRVMVRQVLLNLLSHALHVVRGDLVITLTSGERESLIEISESPANDRTAPSTPPAVKSDDVSLVVVQTLIEKQGGHLEIDNGHGNWRASVSLPTRQATTLLVVEDNEDIIALFKRYLAGHQVRVIAAANGEQALRLAAEVQPDAITLDVIMPGEDGWEILQRLRNMPETKHVPIVVCSVLNEPRLALSTGASDFVAKPVNRTELLEALQRLLGPLLRPV